MTEFETRPEASAAGRWPFTLADQYRMYARMGEGLVDAIACLESGDRQRALLVCGGRILISGYHHALLASVLVNARAQVSLVPSPYSDYLAGASSELPPVQVRTAAAGPPRFAKIRRLLRTASWSPVTRLPRSLLAPEAVAISHNHLLCAEARHHAIGYRHAASILPEESWRDDGDAGLAAELAKYCAMAIVAPAGLPEDLAFRLRRMLESLGKRYIGQALGDLSRARQIRKLPMNIWSGSAGYWPARVIGIEILRRGGNVTRFEHGGDFGFRREHATPAYSEFVGTSTFVLPTEALADRFRRSVAGAFPPRPAVRGGRGDPTYRPALRPRVKSRMRRVLYGTPPFVGPRGMFPPILPDALGFELQKRVVRILKSIPVQLLLRPHPEGLRGGSANPLAALHPCEGRSYDDLLPEADVLLFDHVVTTTFTMALCSDRPIVMLDYGIRFFADDIEAMLDRRCARVPIVYDERGFPDVSASTLRDAILGAPDRVDAEPYRSLFLGTIDR